MPGDVPGGILATILIGIGGGVVGGGIVSFLGGVGTTGLNVWTIVVATMGAVLLLFVYRAVAGRSSV